MSNFLINNNFYQGTADVSQPVQADPIFEPRAVFSLNASNQLEGTFWLVENGQHVKTDLNQMSFIIRDSDGTSTGITQSAITPDGLGFFRMNRVSGIPIQDLEHYTVEIEIETNDDTYQGVVAITLGE